MKRRRVVSKRYAQRLSDALEKERFHIASEIHDDLGIFLSLISNDLTYVRACAFLLPARQRAALERASGNVDTIIQRVRDRVWMLSMPLLDHITLAQALQELCSSLNSYNTGHYHFTQRGDAGKLSLQHKIQLFRIVQEILMNVIKHADASHVSVHLQSDLYSLVITIEDNGRRQYTVPEKQPRGLGQFIIRHRLSIIGASLAHAPLPVGTRRTIALRRT